MYIIKCYLNLQVLRDRYSLKFRSYCYNLNTLSGSIAASGRWFLIFLQARTLRYSIFKTSLRYIHDPFFEYHECTYVYTAIH